MRNLKKILSLVLALMMVLSVMVTASATDFTDDEDIEYKEAVEVMTTLRVLNGVGDEFLPKDYLNRAAGAKIVAYIMEGGELPATIVDAIDNPFSDVPGWAEDVVKYCYANGVVDGMGDGTYLPRDYLTGYAFAKMLLVAIGIDGEYTGSSWKQNIAKAAKEAELLKGLEDVPLSSNLTREQGSQMAFNAMKYSPTGALYTVLDVEFDNLYDALVFAKLMGKAETDVHPVTPSDCLLKEKFGVSSIASPADDAFGRPAISGWEDADGNPIYITYATPLAVITDGTFDSAETAEGEAWYGWDFTGVTVVYNGGSDSNVTISDLAHPGYTVELYGAKSGGTYTVTKAVVTEYYFATIADVATNGDITLSVKEAGYVITNSGAAKSITVAADKTDPNYLALAGYEEGTALALCLKPGWDETGKFAILDVEEPDAIEGTITTLAVEDYYNGYAVINGQKYTFAWEYSQDAVTVGATGTFYLKDGLILGYKAPDSPPIPTDLVYVVAGYKIEGVQDKYGVKSDTYWVQCVDMDGNEVIYQVASDQSSITAGLYKVSTAYNSTVDADVATFTTASGTTATATVAANAVKIANNHYFTNDVKFIYVGTDVKSDLTVTVKEGVQALTSASVEYLPVAAADGVNSTVSRVIVKTAYTAPTVKSSSVMYGNESADSIVKTTYVDAYGVTQNTGYVHNVYIDGVATAIITTSDTAINGFQEFSKAGDLYTVDDLTADNLIAATAITNMFDGMMSISGHDDLPVAGVTVVNATGNAKVPTDATALSTADTVALVLDASGNVVLIYVTATSRT